MKNRVLCVLLVVAMVFCLFEGCAQNEEKTYQILFIGNSYTFTNTMADRIFGKIAEAAGKKVEITVIAKSGATLGEFADEKSSYGTSIDKVLQEKEFDYVVLQEQSLMPVVDPGAFYDGVRALYKKIETNGATPVLYSTWARKEGSTELEPLGLTNETMTYKLAAAYEAIGKELGIACAPVGLTFYDISQNTEIELYSEDFSHPSYKGSYLAAMTLFAQMFDLDTTEISYDGIDTYLTKEEALELKKAAMRAVDGEYVIPDNYITTSEGITVE